MVRSTSRKSAAMRSAADDVVHEHAAVALTAMARVDGNGENLRLVGGEAHGDEAGEAARTEERLEAERQHEHRRVGHQRGEVVDAPRAAESVAMDRGEFFGLRRQRAIDQRAHPKPPDHRRAIRAAACGLASGGRR